MSVNEDTLRALVEMGIDPTLARAAAIRFHHIEPAVNWCFGEGADWKPEHVKEVPAGYSTTQQTDAARVQHREVVDATDLDTPPRTPPSFPPRPDNNIFTYPGTASQVPTHSTINPTTLKSNNPFLPTAPSSPVPIFRNDDDEGDEELRKALAMSKEDVESESRQERERSVRASGAPPPSPEQEETVTGTLFGPSERVDEEGKMAIVPASQNANPPDQPNKEDEDLNRAIQDSLMTASFHSASAPREFEKPTPTRRQLGAPVVLYSESAGQSTYAATFLQTVLAIPQVREAIARSLVPPDIADNACTALQTLVDQFDSSDKSFIEIDDLLRMLRGGSETGRQPPEEPTQRLHDQVVVLIQNILRAARERGSADRIGASDDFWTHPLLLFQSEIDSDQLITRHATYVQFMRQPLTSPDLNSSLASILWTPEAPGQSIEVLSDVLTVKLGWRPGAVRELWKLEERVVLDRFMKENAGWSAQIRAQQAVAAGNARRLRERIDGFTVFKGQSVHDSIRTLIKHYDSSPLPEDAMQAQARDEMKAKLEKTLTVLQTKAAVLEEEFELEKQKADGGLFQTDDPQYQRHVYILRGILFHTGALVAGKHLYAYVRSDNDRWWRIQEHEAVSVQWEEVKDDRAGLFMDGGAYLLMYSRDGPRLASGPAAVPMSSPLTPSPSSTEGDELEELRQGVEDVSRGEGEQKVDEGDLISLAEGTEGGETEVERKGTNVAELIDVREESSKKVEGEVEDVTIA